MSLQNASSSSLAAQTRALLARHGLSPKKSLGQNFLIDRTVQERIVAAAQIADDDIVVEIGAGLGALTNALSRQARRVIAIERDARLAQALRAELVDRSNLTLVEGDALDFDLVGASREAGRGLVVVGNLPYLVTSPVLFAAVDAAKVGRAVSRAVFMVQKEFAQRMLAPPGNRIYGRLSVMVQQAVQMEILFHVGPHSFFPMPSVTSTVVRMIPRERPLAAVADEALFARLVREAFGARRKMLRRALEPAFGNRIETALAAAGIAGTRRAEELAVADFARLANVLSKTDA